MKTIGDMLGKTQNIKERDINYRPPPHEISASANLIEETGLFTKKYSRTYWMGKIKRAGVGYSEMIGILKEIRNMPAKYSKGGRLTNLLTEKAKVKKNNAKEKTN